MGNEALAGGDSGDEMHGHGFVDAGYLPGWLRNQPPGVLVPSSAARVGSVTTTVPVSASFYAACYEVDERTEVVARRG